MKKKKTYKQEINSSLKKEYLPFLLFFIVGFAIYSNSLKSPFVLDDYKIITENLKLKKEEIFYDFNLPRYIGYITFALNYRINKSNTLGYHLINIIIHIINALLIYFVSKKILELIRKDYYKQIPFLISLLFLVHPIQTQAVTYIVQRFTSLAALFTFLSILSYFSFRTKNNKRILYYFLFLLFTLLAFKTKENTASLPIAILVIELLIFGKKNYIKRTALILPAFFLIFVIPISFININKSLNSSLFELMSELKEASYETPLINRSQYLFTEFKVIMTYFRLLFLPLKQSLHYIYPLSYTLFEFKTFISFSLLIILIGLAFINRKKNLEISIGFFLFLIFLSVESSIIPIQDVIFEHRLYLPSAGFFISFVCLIYKIMQNKNLKYFNFVIIIIAIGLSVLTYKRNEVWKDEITIWKDVVKKFPTDHIAWSALGAAYGKIDKCDDAIKAFKKAFEINPNYAKGHNNLAICYTKKGMIQDAMKEYQIAINIDPNYGRAYYNLGSLYFQYKDFYRALETLKKSITLDPENPKTYMQIGNTYCAIGKFNEAIQYFNKSIDMDQTSADSYFNFGLCLLSMGNYSEARSNFFKTLELNPLDVDNYFFIAHSYDKEGDMEKAVEFYIRFLKEKPSRKDLEEKAQWRLYEIKKMLTE